MQKISSLFWLLNDSSKSSLEAKKITKNNLNILGNKIISRTHVSAGRLINDYQFGKLIS